MIQIKVYLEVNKDLVQLFDGLLPTVPRVGEFARFPYKKTYMTAQVVNVTHNFEQGDVCLVVKVLDESPTMNAGAGALLTQYN